jgi:DNA-binding NtrC family response regulator
LNVITINLPPLRERQEDIPLLIRHFLHSFQVRLDRVITGVDPLAAEILLHYDWPGNVRQLENVIEHAVVLSRDGFIRPENLPPELTSPAKTEGPQEKPTERAIDEQRLREVLDSVGWNRSRAARRLGVNRTTVWRKIKEYGLTCPQD